MIKEKLKQLTGHKYVQLTSRGNAAIEASLQNLKGKILIPDEGSWLSYKKIAEKFGLEVVPIACNDAVIDLHDLRFKLAREKHAALLYQNPGGYHATQPMREIYQICKDNNCLVIIDVSGSIGTELCNGNYADVMVGSFGKWKLVNAEVGGFISGNERGSKPATSEFNNSEALKSIEEKLNNLPNRINYLQEIRKKIIKDLELYEIVNKNDLGFVVVVKFKNEKEKEKIINYCNQKKLEYTECPRSIRLNKPAISIEVKRK